MVLAPVHRLSPCNPLPYSRTRTSLSCVTMTSAPTRSPYSPRFLEYDCDTRISRPLSTNSRGAKASLSRSPVAKPWAVAVRPRRIHVFW